MTALGQEVTATTEPSSSQITESATLILADNIIIEGDEIYVPPTATKAVKDWAQKKGVVVRFSDDQQGQQGQKIHMVDPAKKQFIADFTPKA